MMVGYYSPGQRISIMLQFTPQRKPRPDQMYHLQQSTEYILMLVDVYQAGIGPEPFRRAKKHNKNST
jgi:hypothetical protein